MITRNDKENLRQLAARYAEMVNSEEMKRRRERWRLSNRLLQRTVPFLIEDNGTYLQDLMQNLVCEGKLEREFEQFLLHALTNWEFIPDDRIFSPYYPVAWIIKRPEMCPALQINRVADGVGRSLGFETNTPLADLDAGMKLLQRGEFSVDIEATYFKLELASSIFGDLLPAQIVCNQPKSIATGMAYKAVNWMGMDNFYMAMIDQPESIHRLFDFIASEANDFLEWLQQKGLLRSNGGEFSCGSGSIGYTDELPRRNVPESGPWLPEDCWGATEAQEAVGISNEMFAEFIFPYMNRIASRFGLVYYGCCEPAHSIWSTIRQFRNLRKISISPWCNQRIMAEAVGKNYVLSRKPHPMQLCGEFFNPESFSSHIKETLDISQKNFVELILRDTCTLNGTMKERIAQACNIVKALIGR